MSIQWKPDKRAFRFLKLCDARMHERSDDEVAKQYDLSPEALYRQLANDGYPVCPECGVLYPDKEHQHENAPRKRLARRGTSEAVELPPAAAAADLLRSAIEKMEGSVSSLYSRREFYRDERFETVQHIPSAGATFRRDQFPDEEAWRQICDKYGEDPDQERIFVLNAGFTESEGAFQTPPKPLSELIGTYVLADEPLEPLLAVLHPDPSKVDTKRLEQAVQELTHKAGQLASLVRGGRIRQGQTTGELTPQELVAAWHVTKRRSDGASDEEIYQELHPHGYTREDVKRLGNLRREPPN